MDSFAESFSKQASGAEAFRIKHRRGPPAGDGPAPPSAQDLPGLFATLECFQDLFRPLSEHWLKRFKYYEAWPQLLLQAYLQRVVNSGGRIEREYGLGRGRTDPPGRVAAGGKRTAVRDRVQDLAGRSARHTPQGIGPNRGLYGPLRRPRRPSRAIRPYEATLERQGVSIERGGCRQGHRGVGHVSARPIPDEFRNR